jgi:Tol biopolymer transport system component
MNDDELFRRLAAHAGSAEVDPGFDDRLYDLLQGEMGRRRRSTRTVLLLVAALLLALAVGSTILVGSGIVDPPVLPESRAPRLAYSVDGDIYLADWDGGDAVRVADGVALDGRSPQCGQLSGVVWAPDGRHFAYRSTGDDPCPEEVHVRDAEGHLVTSVSGSGWDVSWSPDSTRFATWVEVFETIGIYGIDGERQALLTVPGGCDAGDDDPQWSPDGTSVVVESWRCEMPIDGSTPQRLLHTDPRANYEWVYSPDGTRVAFVEVLDRSVVIAEADGTVLQVVGDDSADTWYDSLVWSPSGDRVLFSRESLSGADFPQAASELRMVDIGTGQVTTIAAEPGIRPIRFSPEGDRILFSTGGDLGPTELWSIDTDGSHMRLLVRNPVHVAGDWQPVTGGD